MAGDPSKLEPEALEIATPAIEALASIRHCESNRRAERSWRSAPPRLSLSHLLLWTAFSALFLAAVRKLNSADPGTGGLILASLGAIGYGAAWTGVSIWLARLLRDDRWPVEPGHWLLVVVAVRLALDMAIQLWLSPWLRSPETVLDAVTVCCLVMPLLSRSLPAIWEFCFVSILLFYACPLIVAVIDGWIFVPAWVWQAVAAAVRWHEAVLATIVGLFAVVDLPDRRQRGWLHWSGIAVCLWMAAHSLLAR